VKRIPANGSGAAGSDVNRDPNEWKFLGSSSAARQIRNEVLRAARADATVLITGESGVGKELVARELHRRSARAPQPFVTVNCAAIPDTLIESELFGHEAGAFTDARTKRRGAFELAVGGTLFLDEVGDLSLYAQPKLLRAIETGEIARVGSEQTQQLDLRIIAATNHDLRAMCKREVFRWDLYYRLRIVEIHILPLRERPEDISELALHFATAIAKKMKKEFRGISPGAAEKLRLHPWPGNVRELRAVVENAMTMFSGALLSAESLRLDPVSSPAQNLEPLLDRSWHSAKEQFESTYATRLLRSHGENVTEAARAAGLSRRSLYKILHRLGLRRGTR
jgi:DNA-binding NtrC family response regulator